MAGVREDLILDITSAQRSIDALEAQITSAFSGIDITIDTSGIAREITAATEAADTNVHIEADTAGLASEITRAVDVADASVDISADTSAARAEVRALDTDIKSASGSAKGLGIALTGAGLLLGARGLFALAEASSAVNEQVTGSEIVFGRLATGVQQFADQADRIGLAEVQALQLSNTFGQLALSAGLSDAAVADFATTIVERGADIASLRDIDLTQTLDALRSGLVGETEPLRNIGIFMNEALVQSEAYRLGIAELGTELTDAQKIQARYSIILEQSEIAAGNFALTQEGLANTQRQIRAELQDLAADSGRLLEPTFLNLAQLTRDDLLPSLAQLGEEALPAIGSILESLAPLLGITLDILLAGAPILQVTADVLEIIPAPLIAMAAGWVAVNRAQRLATRVDNIQAVEKLASGVGTLGLKVRGLASSSLGSTALLAGTAGLMALATSEAGSNVLGNLGSSVLRLGDSFTNFGDNRAERASGFIKDIIGGLDTTKVTQAQLAVGRLSEELAGLREQEGKGRLFSVGDVNVFATGSDAERQEHIDQLNEQIDTLQATARAEIEAGIATGRFTDEQIRATFVQTEREKPASAIIRQLQLLQLEEERSARNAQGIIDKYEGVADAYVGVADAIDRVRTEAPQVESIIRAIRTGGDRSEETFLGLAIAIDGASLSAEGMGDVAAALGTDTEHLAGFVETLTGALDDFVETATSGLPTVADVLGNVQSQVDDAAGQSAQAVRDAADERAQAVLDATSAQLDGSKLGAADVDRIRQAGEDRADAIRDAGEAEAAAIEENASISVSQFAKGLRDQAAELGDFRSDLAALTEAGFGDVAGLLAEQGFEAGDAFADELAAALESGNTGIIETLRESNQAFEDESEATVAFLRDELGPELLSVTGLISSAITESFGEGLDFEEKLRIAAALAKAELDPQGEAIAAIAATQGSRAARAYGEALKLDEETIAAGIKAGVAIGDAAPVDEAKTAGERVGGGFLEGFLSIFENSTIDLSVVVNRGGGVQARRAGGTYGPGWRLVGEEGPELDFVSRAGFIATAQQFASAIEASRVPAFGLRDFAGPARSASDDERLAQMIAERIAAALPPQPLAQFTLDGSKRSADIARDSTAHLKSIERRSRR